jgi:acyl-CoA thioesterase-1
MNTSLVLSILVFTAIGLGNERADTPDAAPTSPSPALQRWIAAVGEKDYAHGSDSEAYAFVDPNPNLPSVLIIGDSISLGYTPVVRRLLNGQANVFRIPENGGTTVDVLQSLSKWLDALGQDHFKVIVFNAGLHDLIQRAAKDGSGPSYLVPLSDYGPNLEKIVSQLQPHADTLLWISTTVVPEGEPKRKAGDEVTYNQAAADVMNKHHISIIDLYTLSQVDRSLYALQPNNVHYNAAGYQRLGTEVANQISRALK